MQKLNILIIEGQEELFLNQLKGYKKFFLYCGLKIEAFHADGEKSARKLILIKKGKERIHIVISDIFTVGPKRGLLYIQRLKEDFPDLLFIANSREDITYRDTDAKWPSFDIYVDKNMLNRHSSKVYEPIKQQFFQKFKQDVDVYISDQSDLSNLNKKHFPSLHLDRELCSLASQVLFSKGVNDEYMHPTKVILTPLTGGYSGSYVYRMEVLCEVSGLKTVPAVLKISSKANAAIEVTNYKKFVKWILPNGWRVEVLGEGEVKNWGAICYSFAHSAGNKFDSLTHSLQEKDFETVNNVIEKIFSSEVQTWYAQQAISISEEDITSHYSNEYFPTTDAIDKSKRSLLVYAQKFLSADSLSERGVISVGNLGIKIKEPSTRLFSDSRGVFSQSISHGDLNSNNILVADGELTFIDFQSTGRKHVFNDFITFEGSLRTFYGQTSETMEELLRLEGVVSSIDNLQNNNIEELNLTDLYKLIFKTRQAAINNFPNESFDNYLYGTTVFSFRLMRIDDFTNIQYKRLLCQILAGMCRL